MGQPKAAAAEAPSEATATAAHNLTSSQRIVSEALRQHRAARTIVSFLRRSVEVRRRNHGIRGGGGGDDGNDDQMKRAGQQGTNAKWVVGGNEKKRRRTALKTPPPKRGDGLGIAQSHWAWSSLMAPSLRVRRATTRLLLDGVVPPSQSPIQAQGPCFETLDGVIATLLDLADQNLLLPITADATTTSSSIPSDANDAAHNGRRGYGMDTGGDPSLQLLGLLTHLVTEEPLLRMASERSVLDQMVAGVAAVEGGGGASSSSSSIISSSSSSLASPAELIESDRSIESFVASGGLRWVAASLLRVVVELTTRTTAAAAPSVSAGAGAGNGDDMELLT